MKMTQGSSVLVLSNVFRLVVVLSGVAGLGYQMVWSKMLSVALGHEVIAVLAVVAAFFVGLALGAVSLNSRITRTQYPQRWYVVCECVIAIWSLVLMALLPWFNYFIAGLIGAQPSPLWHWSVAFGSTLILLLPATFFMGATLPAIERVFADILKKPKYVSILYAFNTLGAMLGAMLATFYLVPGFGLSFTLSVLVAVNVCCAASMLILWKKQTPLREQLFSGINQIWINKKPIHLLFTLFVCGWLGLGYEVLVVRALSQILENTVYTFTAVLCIYLFGTAVGAYCYQRFYVRNQTKYHVESEYKWRSVRYHLLCFTAISCLLGTLSLWLGESIYLGVMHYLGGGRTSAVIAEMSVAFVVLFFPTFAMGLLFTHLIKRTISTVGLGMGLAVNTVGSAIAPLTFGVVILPILGSQMSLIMIALSYLYLLAISAPTATRRDGSRLRTKKWLIKPVLLGTPLILSAFIVLAPLPNNYVAKLADSKQLIYEQGVMAAVEVTQDRAGGRHLRVNNQYTMGGTASRFSDHRQTHIPFLLQGQPEQALYLGVGTGITMDAAQYYPQTQVTAVELIPELLPLLEQFYVDIHSGDWSIKPLLMSADARRYMLSTDKKFDVIVAEIFHPSRDGAGALYTVEHFQQIREKLSPDGLFCQWLPLFQLNIPTLQSIVRSFLLVFPDAQMYMGHFSLKQPILCLVGRQTAAHIPPNWLEDNITYGPLQQQLIASRLNSDVALLGGFMADSDALFKLSGDGPLNTDDYPYVTYQASEFVYSAQQSAGERLLEILSMLPKPNALSVTDDMVFARQLEAYWAARNLFLQAGARVMPADTPLSILMKTYPQLIAAVRISSDFEPAYRALMGLAKQVYDVNPKVALNLLDELNRVAPMFPQARRLGQQLQSINTK